MAKLDLDRTIVALGSGVASGRRAVVRLSGQQTVSLLEQLLAEPGRQALSSARRAQLIRTDCYYSLQRGSSSSSLEICRRTTPVLCYLWPNDRSYTGEPCAELHIPGALPLVESLIETLIALGASAAERGEFTLRSFLAGKLDLTQAEAVLGVIEADSPAELERALGQLAGSLSAPIRELRNELLELTAHLEAGLDFVEEDIEFISNAALAADLKRIEHQLASISARLISRGSRSRAANVVLVGLPNAGKSSLLNAMVGSSRAIVSDQAGTTRDAVTATIAMHDREVELVDTAGMEELTDDSPRALAQGVLEARLTTADVILFCIDSSCPPTRGWFDNQWSRLRQLADVIVVGTKSDLSNEPVLLPFDVRVQHDCEQSITTLKSKLASRLNEEESKATPQAMHWAMLRSRESIDLARQAIDRALTLVSDAGGEELVATELRLALDDLAAIIGEIHTEDVLGQIFSRFCIGK